MSAQQQFLHRLSDYEIDEISSSSEMQKSKLWVYDRVRSFIPFIEFLASINDVNIISCSFFIGVLFIFAKE